jgi:hypothetical protein
MLGNDLGLGALLRIFDGSEVTVSRVGYPVLRKLVTSRWA